MPRNGKYPALKTRKLQQAYCIARNYCCVTLFFSAIKQDKDQWIFP
jgi:hypothetical protein